MVSNEFRYRRLWIDVGLPTVVFSSAYGYKQTSSRPKLMSAYPPTGDIHLPPPRSQRHAVRSVRPGEPSNGYTPPRAWASSEVPAAHIPAQPCDTLSPFQGWTGAVGLLPSNVSWQGDKALSKVRISRASSSATPTFWARATPTRRSRPPSRPRSMRKPGSPCTATPPAPSTSPRRGASRSRSSTTSATR